MGVKVGTLFRKAVERLLCKDSKSFGVQLVDLAQVVEELIRWRKECSKERDPWVDPVRIAMIDSFEDILLNAIVEE